MTLVIDIALPFTTISILNAILISAIRNRNRNLESFGEGVVSNRSLADMSITTERNYAGYRSTAMRTREGCGLGVHM